MAQLNIIETTSNSITVKATNIAIEYYSERRIEWYIDGVLKQTVDIPNNSTSSYNYTFTGLSSGMEYQIEGKIYQFINGSHWRQQETAEGYATTSSSSSGGGGSSGEEDDDYDWSRVTLNISQITSNSFAYQIKGFPSNFQDYIQIGITLYDSDWNEINSRTEIVKNATSSKLQLWENLDSGTLYRIIAEIKYLSSSGYWQSVTTLYETATTSSIDIMSNASLSFTTYPTSKMIRAEVIGMGTYTSGSIDWYLNNSYQTSENLYGSSSSAQQEFSNLEYDKTYTVKAIISYIYQNRAYTKTLSNSFILEVPGAEGAEIIITEITPRTITAQIIGLDTNYSRDDRKIYWYLGVALNSTVGLKGKAPASDPKTFTGLSEKKEYKIYARIEYTSAGEVLSKTLPTVYATTTSSRPDNFYWTSTVSSGSPFQMTATEWKSFYNRINEFEEYKGIAKTSFSTPVKGGKFYAYYYNDALEAIKNLGVDNSSDTYVSPGDPISAKKINRLTTLLNSIE